MDIPEIEQLVGIIREAGISELTVSTGTDNKSTVRLRKTLQPSLSVSKPVASSKAGRQPASTPLSQSEDAAAGGLFITAPMVGIFHSMDSIIAPNAVIKSGQGVGTIESMKLMNDVLSEHDGLVVEVLVEDGMPVEYGQNLFRIEKS